MGSTIHVTLLSHDVVNVQVTVRNQAGETIPASLAQTIATEIKNKTGCRGEVAVEMIPSQIYSTL